MIGNKRNKTHIAIVLLLILTLSFIFNPVNSFAEPSSEEEQGGGEEKEVEAQEEESDDQEGEKEEGQSNEQEDQGGQEKTQETEGKQEEEQNEQDGQDVLTDRTTTNEGEAPTTTNEGEAPTTTNEGEAPTTEGTEQAGLSTPAPPLSPSSIQEITDTNKQELTEAFNEIVASLDSSLDPASIDIKKQKLTEAFNDIIVSLDTSDFSAAAIVEGLKQKLTETFNEIIASLDTSVDPTLKQKFTEAFNRVLASLESSPTPVLPNYQETTFEELTASQSTVATSSSPNSVSKPLNLGGGNEINFNDVTNRDPSSATLEFDNPQSDGYNVGDTVNLKVTDTEANTDPLIINTVFVRVTSTTDPNGIVIPLTETGPNTNIFTGAYSLTNDLSSENAIQVKAGDDVQTIYDDIHPRVRTTIDGVTTEGGSATISEYDIPPDQLSVLPFHLVGNPVQVTLTEGTQIDAYPAGKMTVTFSYANTGSGEETDPLKRIDPQSLAIYQDIGGGNWVNLCDPSLGLAPCTIDTTSMTITAETPLPAGVFAIGSVEDGTGGGGGGPGGGIPPRLNPTLVVSIRVTEGSSAPGVGSPPMSDPTPPDDPSSDDTTSDNTDDDSYSSSGEQNNYDNSISNPYRARILQLDADVKNLVIIIPFPSSSDQNIGAEYQEFGNYKYLPLHAKVVEGTQVTWINTNPDVVHGLSVADNTKEDGAIEFYHSSITSKEPAVTFTFTKPGLYTYSDPNHKTIDAGTIEVVSRADDKDNPLTDANSQTVGLFLSTPEKKEYYNDYFKTKGYRVLATLSLDLSSPSDISLIPLAAAATEEERDVATENSKYTLFFWSYSGSDATFEPSLLPPRT